VSVSRILFPQQVSLKRTTIIHLWTTVARRLLRPTRKLWAGHPRTLPYLVLHRVGFTEHPRSPGDLVRSYRTVAPLPRTRFCRQRLDPVQHLTAKVSAGRYRFCGTSLHVTVTPCYGAPCPPVFGLSSGYRIQRSFGHRQPIINYKT